MAKAVARAKAKKKKWIPMLSPRVMGEKMLGEAYVSHEDELIGRSVSMNMAEVTGNRKLQNMNVNCEVKNIEDGKAYTFCRGFEMSGGAVKRFVRKGRDRVDDSFTVKTADGLMVRIKPMAVTTNNTSKPVQTRMRNKSKQLLRKEFSKKSYNEMLNSILSFDLQRNMKNELGKVYPVRNFEIRVFKLLDKDKVPAETVGEKKSSKKSSSKSSSKPAKKEEADEKEEKAEKEKKPKPKKSKKAEKKEEKKQEKESEESEDAEEEDEEYSDDEGEKEEE